MAFDIQQLVLKAKEYLDIWYDDGHVLYEQVLPNICYSKTVDGELSIDILEPLQATFSQKLFELIRKKGVSETECYKRANLDRRLFSKIRSDDEYQPKKNTVFALIFSLKLNLKDAEDLLEAAGYSISHSLKKDVIIEFLIKNHVYDIFTVNEVLHKFRCSLIGNVG